MAKPWEERTDEELIGDAQAGMKGQGALVEAMRRLRLGIDSFKSSSDRYADRMLWLTIVLAVLTLVQVIAVFLPLLRE